LQPGPADFAIGVASWSDMTLMGAIIPPQYGSGYEELDRDHVLLIQILSDLKAATNAPPSRLNDLMLQLRAYLDAHFEHEEQLMQQFQYYDTAAHQASHRDIKQQAERLADAIAADIPTAIAASLRAIEGWIEEHMCGVDRKLAEFLSERDQSV
jgi:hemerythrin-like metal-binding protein